MNKIQKIALIRQLLAGADTSPARCYILEVGETLPADYRQGVDRIVWAYNVFKSTEPEIKGKNDMAVGLTNDQTISAFKKFGEFLDNDRPSFEPMQPIETPTPKEKQEPTPKAVEIPPAKIPPIEPDPIWMAVAPPPTGYRRTRI